MRLLKFYFPFVCLFLISCQMMQFKSTKNRDPQSTMDAMKDETLKGFATSHLAIPAISVDPVTDHLTIKFGRLSPEDFLKLKNSFMYLRLPAAFHPQYDKDKEYELTDFLPPKIQALSNLRNLGTVSTSVPYEFQNIGTTFLGGTFQEEIYFDTNCWGTVHDILLSESKPLEINFYNSQDKTIQYFTNPAYFEKVEKFSDIQPYDVIIHYESDAKEIADHFNIYLGQGLVFEKTGLDETSHYRVAFAELRMAGTGRINIYRPKEGVSIRSPQDLWAFVNSRPRIGYELEKFLKKKPENRDFFNNLILIEKIPKQDSFFESSQLKAQVFYDPHLGRYKIKTDSFPGNQYVPALHTRPSF